jgi:hypothetical protein
VHQQSVPAAVALEQHVGVALVAVDGGLGPVAVDVRPVAVDVRLVAVDVKPAAEDVEPVPVAEDALVAGEPEEEGCYERAQKHGWLRLHRVAEVGAVQGG